MSDLMNGRIKIVAKRVIYCACGVFFACAMTVSLVRGQPDLFTTWWARSFLAFGFLLSWYMGLFASDKTVSDAPIPFP
jgi:hypothetical protein